MNWTEYLAESARTIPENFALHADKVEPAVFQTILERLLVSVAWADKVKKGLIYGKPFPDISASTGDLDYTRIDPNALHAILGIFTEAGELLEHLHNVLTNRTPLDIVNVHEELGDLFWYIAMLYRTVGGSPFADLDRNIEKLRVRYPERFTSSLALNRDLVAERAVLASLHEAAINTEVNDDGKAGCD